MTSLTWLFTIAGLVSLDARTINPVLPAIAASLAATPGQVGYAATAYTVAYGALQLFWGPFADRYGRIRAVRIATIAFAVGAIASALAASVGQFVAARLLTGLFAAATIPTTYAYIGDTVPYEARPRTIGRFSAMMSAAQALSSAVAGAVTLVVSWRLMFAGYAALALLCVLPLFRVPDSTRPSRALERVSYATILARPAARWVYLAAFGEGFFVWGGTTYLGVVAYRRLGFNEFESGVLLGCYGLGTVLGGITLPRVSGRFGERVTARLGGFGQGVAWALLIPNLGWPVFAAALILFGLSWSWLHATLQMNATEIAPEARGKAFSLFPLSFFMGGSLGTALIGRLVDAGLLTAAIAACAVGLTAIGLYAGRRR